MKKIPPFPDKKYQVIYADPPWKYNFSKSGNRRIENHYSTMSTAEICEIKIPVAENAVLYLWSTAPKLVESLKVLKSWGFEYKTHAVWDKGKLGMGYWFRGQHEVLLVGTKGKFSPPDPNLRTGSIFRFERGRHSKKPEEIRKMIEMWFPHAKKLELFARDNPEGWDAWGDEI